MYTYTVIQDLNGNNLSIRRSDGAFIPFDDGNIDYQVYLMWVADGNVAPVEIFG